MRFFDEIIGEPVVGIVGRGSASEIGTFAHDVTARTMDEEAHLLTETVYKHYRTCLSIYTAYG